MLIYLQIAVSSPASEVLLIFDNEEDTTTRWIGFGSRIEIELRKAAGFSISLNAHSALWAN